MIKLNVEYISNNLWISKSPLTNLYFIGFKDYIIYKNSSSFSLYNNRILAVKQNSTVFIHLYDITGIEVEDALTLICSLNEKDEFDFAMIKIDDIYYKVDKKCNIKTIKGRN